MQVKQPTTSNKKRGVTVIEGLIAVAVFAALSVLATIGYQEIMFRIDKAQLVRQVSEIDGGANTWGEGRSNFNGVSMTVLCAAGQQSISASTCGGVGGNGSGSNKFGGNFVLTVAANAAQKSLQITNLPAARINEIADSLAQSTADVCESRVDCDTLTIAGTTITLTM